MVRNADHPSCCFTFHCDASKSSAGRRRISSAEGMNYEVEGFGVAVVGSNRKRYSETGELRGRDERRGCSANWDMVLPGDSLVCRDR